MRLPPDPRSDLYALGVMLHQLLAGERPFNAPDLVQLLSKILTEDPPDLAERRPDVPAELVAIVERCLAKMPEQRHESAMAVAAALLPLAGGVHLDSPAVDQQPDGAHDFLRPIGRDGETPLAFGVRVTWLQLRYLWAGGKPDLVSLASALLERALVETGTGTDTGRLKQIIGQMSTLAEPLENASDATWIDDPEGEMPGDEQTWLDD